MTDRDLAHLVERAEIAAFTEIFRAAPARFGLEVDAAEPGVSFRAPKVDAFILNRTVGLGIERHATEEDIAGAVEWHRESGAKNYGIQVSPHAQPVHISDWLAGLGLVKADAWTKVYRGADPIESPPTELRIEVAAASQANAFGLVACEGFGMPPALAELLACTIGRPGWRHYLALDEDEPAAAAAMHVQGDVAWLGIAATRALKRRRGGQSALMAKRIQDGLARGCRWFVTETGQDRTDLPNPSFHNMLRAGFTVAYHRPNFIPKRPS